MSTNTPTPHFQPAENNKGCMYAAIGCGTLLLLLILMVVGFGIYAARNVKRLGADLVVAAAEQVIQEADLPAEQSERLLARISSLGDDFKTGRVTLEQFGEITQRMTEDKSLVAGSILLFVEKGLLEHSNVDEEQSDAAILALQRITRGVIEEKIELASLEDLVNQFIEPGPNNSKQVKKNLTKEDVDQIILEANEIADEADIPNEPFSIDIVEEFEQIIDEVLEGTEPQ